MAIGPSYECHACGREYAAGLVRVPRAWGTGGEGMVDAATALDLPYPETAVIAEETLGDQTLVVASELPERPLVLGGCCCAHIGAVEALATRHDQLALVWFDAHGDLNTPETSPSSNEWGMALRMILDGGAVESARVALVGVRDLDPPERNFIDAMGLHEGEDALGQALGGSDGVYVAIDGDALDETEVSAWMPVPGGIPVAELERTLARVSEHATVVGVGLAGFLSDPANLVPATRLCVAAGL